MILRSYRDMARILFISVFFFCTGQLFAQDTEYSDLVEAETLLKEHFDQLYSDSLADPEPVVKEILSIMPACLALPGAMDYPWSKLDRIGVISSEDNQIRIFTWQVEDDPDHYRYFGYIQVGMKRGRMKVVPLADNQEKQRSVYRFDQSPENWFGKLYYGIVTTKSKRKAYYALLGMDFNDSHSTIKTVEVMRILRSGPVFEKEMFFNGRDRVDRVVLEYSSQVAISVRFDTNLEMITFDHLVPFHEIYQGHFEFYGPDGSYNGLEFEGGTWIFREDIDARMEY